MAFGDFESVFVHRVHLLLSGLCVQVSCSGLLLLMGTISVAVTECLESDVCARFAVCTHACASLSFTQSQPACQRVAEFVGAYADQLVTGSTLLHCSTKSGLVWQMANCHPPCFVRAPHGSECSYIAHLRHLVWLMHMCRVVRGLRGPIFVALIKMLLLLGT